MLRTYKVSEIESILQLSRTKTYELVNQNIFPTIRIGKTIRVPVEPFENWMLSQSKQDGQIEINNEANTVARAV